MLLNLPGILIYHALSGGNLILQHSNLLAEQIAPAHSGVFLPLQIVQLRLEIALLFSSSSC